MASKQVAKKLYELIFHTFESGLINSSRITTGSNNQRSEIQFRLMKNIAELQKSPEINDEQVNAIIADANLAHAMGWMTNGTFIEIEKILGDL
jgi:hypothetical protein